MLDLLKIPIEVIKNYTGLKLLFALAALMWVYLFTSEKNKTLRLIFVYIPLIIVVLILFPFTYTLFEKVGLDTDTYYRLLWLIPTGIITVYGIVKLSSRNALSRSIGTIAAVLVIAFTGSFAYNSVYLVKAENLYGVPQDVVNIIDDIRSDDAVHDRITVLFPSYLMLYARQYDGNITMPYGRDLLSFVMSGKFYLDPLYDAFEKSEQIDFDVLLESSRKEYVLYFVFPKDKLTEEGIKESGLIYVTSSGIYDVYKDPVMLKQVEEYDKIRSGDEL